jgi:CBS domain-containing protein
VSGLPVLDHNDRCVGVVSATDILGLEQQQSERADEEFEQTVGSYYDPDTQKWENLRVSGTVDELPELEVAEIMTREVVSVRPGTPVRQVAALMDERRIHRVLVLDEENRLHGLISALDIVRLYAAEK